MKKILLGTSAIVLAGAVASPAFSAEWDVKVGGYMEQFVAYGSTDCDFCGVGASFDGDYDGIDIKEDSEIHFSPSITLDNGLKFQARIELEGRTTGDQIDETYLRIMGSFGEVRIGEDDQVSYNMAYAAPDVTFFNINSGSDTKWYGGSLLTAFTTTYPAIAADPQGISYYSPRMAGFQVGVSYARDSLRASNQAQQDHDLVTTTRLDDPWAVAANYVNSFGDFNVAVSGGYAAGSDATGADSTAWSAGLNVGFSGFTVGGSYAEWDVDDTFGGPSYASGSNTTWDAGVSYETGPWGFSFTYIAMDDDVTGIDFEIDKYLLGVNYALATGVRLNAFASYADASGFDGEGSINEDGFVIGTGVRVDF